MAKAQNGLTAELYKDRYPVAKFTDRDAWALWLKKNHKSPDSIMLMLSKKGGTSTSLTYAEAVEVALIWGWIDSQAASYDEQSWLQRFSVRKAKSPWSKINCAKAEALIKNKQMEAPGLAEVERAKKDGRWDNAYAGPATATVPPDLAAAFEKNKKAKAFFESLDSTNRFAILFRTQAIGKPETRAARVAKFVEMCAKGETIYPVKQTAKRPKSSASTKSKK